MYPEGVSEQESSKSGIPSESESRSQPSESTPASPIELGQISMLSFTPSPSESI